ncbi:hypothetical protein EDB92DRAFT_1862712 [Lactarius akahatsu]|uniref:Uncharacterized protein n=1 Tax=Lactarius akahatsu TaxID=416441 RepID=A0AAD4LJ09_9AGAM|nr:hypothetical protein EDB92DRAFT_1862712 [Lactarius akahatsu]
MGLLDVTFSSDLLPDSVKDRRAIICSKACDPAHIPRVIRIFDKILSRYQYSGPMSTEIVQIMSGWGDTTNLVAVVCMIIARAQRRDDSWFTLVSDALGIQEPVLRGYATHGDSLSLAIFIHVARQQFNHFREGPWPEDEFSKILEAASKFNVEDTLHDLQHEFCSLWNQIVLKGQNDNSWQMSWLILRPIGKVYIDLHRETNSAPIGEIPEDPFSYPLCNIPGHRPDSIPHAHNGSTSTSFSRIASLVPVSIASPDVSSLSVPAPPRADASITDVPPVQPQTAHQTTTENLFIPVTSPDPATSDAFVTSGIMIPRPTSTTSTSASPLSSTSPSTALALQHNVNPLPPSNPPNLPRLVAFYPVLNNVFPTGSRHPIMDTVSPGVSPGPTSAHGLGAAVEDGGNKDPGLRKEEDAIDPPLLNRAIHANTMVTDLPPQSPPLPHISQYLYDIV